MDPQIELKDIHLPASPDFWPPAIGWWLLAVLLIALLYWVLVKAKKYLRIKKHKQYLFDEFAALEEKLKQSPDKSLITETNVLLRRAALVAYPNYQVASLTGKDWLNFLDESGKTTDFSQGAGKILNQAPYQAGQLDNYNGDQFTALISGWIKKNAKKVGGCL